jgi:hypothetical protein
MISLTGAGEHAGRAGGSISAAENFTRLVLELGRKVAVI